MKKVFLSVAVAMAALTVFAKYGGRIELDKADGYYKSGETATCKVLLTKDGKPLNGVKARCLIKWERRTVKTVDFETTGKPVEFSYKGEKPGWAYFGFEVLGKNGKPFKGKDVFKHRMKPTIVTEIGAMFDPDKIVTCVREPKDFDEFWAKRVAEVKAMLPIKATGCEELDSKTPGVKLFAVTFPAPRGLVASGYLAYPENAKPKSLKAGISFQSLTTGDVRRDNALNMAKNGMLGLSATWHGFPVNQPKEYYDKTVPPYFQRGFRGIEDREKWVCSDTFFRVMAELEFVKGHPLWNGRDLMVSGGSLGGIETAFAAAIDPQVTLALIAVPSFCECNAYEAGRFPNGMYRRIPLDDLKAHPEKIETGFYYDTVNFGKRIKCETFVCTGFTDEACCPSNVFAFYNAIPATTRKNMFTNPRTGHYGTTSNPRAGERFNQFVTVQTQPKDAR